MRNFDSELPLFQLTFLTMTAHCSSTSSVSSQASKWLQNRLPSDTDRLYCPPSWMNLCTVRVTWRVRSTLETALLFNPLKFAEFHNQSPLLTMLKSIALNYIQRKDSKPPKLLKKAIKSLKKRNDIIITKPDKGSGVVVMDKDEYSRLLRKASVDDKSKFREVSAERPKTKGRPPKYYHPLLQKEKSSVLSRSQDPSVGYRWCSMHQRFTLGLPVWTP